MSVKLMKAMKNARKVNEELWLQYNAKSIECYKNDDRVGRDYWNERAYQMICVNELIDMDIRKLKEEAKGDKQNA